MNEDKFVIFDVESYIFCGRTTGDIFTKREVVSVCSDDECAMIEVLFEMNPGEMLQSGKYLYMRAGPDELKLLALGIVEPFFKRKRRQWKTNGS